MSTEPTNRYAEEFDRALRASKMKGKQVAQIIGLDPSNISHWRRGERPVPWDRAQKLASIIGTRPELISEEFERLQAAGGTNTIAVSEAATTPAIQRLSESTISELRRLANDLVKIAFLPSHIPPGAQHDIYLPRRLFDDKTHLLEPHIAAAFYYGDEMRGRIEHGDIVFVDTKTVTVAHAGIYAFLWVGKPMIKRIQLIPGGYSLRGTDGDVTDVTGENLLRAFEPQGLIVGKISLSTSI